jgi:hypothetical protein
MLQPSRPLSYDTDEPEPEPVKNTPKKTPLKVQTPPAPLSVKKRALEGAAAEAEMPRSKRS